MRSIEFRVASHECGWLREGETVSVLEFLVDGVPFLELVRQAELPDALAEQAERAAEFTPESAPLLAGDYMYPRRLSCAHLLGGKPDRVPHGAEEGESVLLGCTCGIDDCWALTAKITVNDTTVTWSDFRNTHRDWNYDTIGVLTFSRQHYEGSLRTALADC
ncbi:hypothetical protein ABZ532_22175 [Streptomyces sp. NPDC019396]|uniref:hypothetical protein n=1 Tax=Streptomyces sp. NPDC019396 TaxID=3154687 RepID=UPI0033D923D2